MSFKFNLCSIFLHMQIGLLFLLHDPFVLLLHFSTFLYGLLIFSFLFQLYLKSNRLAEAEDVQRKVLQIMELSKVQYSFSNFLMLNCSLLAFFLLNNSLRMLLFSAPFFFHVLFLLI